MKADGTKQKLHSPTDSQAQALENFALPVLLPQAGVSSEQAPTFINGLVLHAYIRLTHLSRCLLNNGLELRIPHISIASGSQWRKGRGGAREGD